MWEIRGNSPLVCNNLGHVNDLRFRWKTEEFDIAGCVNGLLRTANYKMEPVFDPGRTGPKWPTKAR